jgi:transposase
LTHEHLSVISAVTPEGDLFLKMQEQAFTSEGVIAFLDELQQQIVGRLLIIWDGATMIIWDGATMIIWDGATIHRSKFLKQYLATGAAARLHLERLPGYAPELNPDEGVWHYLKHVELGNVCCRDLAHLRQELTNACEDLRRKPNIIQACFQQTGYL